MTVSVLVVDDEPDIVELFKRRFRRELRNGEFSLQFAISGEDALNQLRTGLDPEVILILSDINMPGMTGIDLLKQVKRIWPQLPVAMITAYGDDKNRSSAFEIGAADFLTKPLDFDKLRTTISKMLASRRSQVHASKHPRGR